MLILDLRLRASALHPDVIKQDISPSTCTSVQYSCNVSGNSTSFFTCAVCYYMGQVDFSTKMTVKTLCRQLHLVKCEIWGEFNSYLLAVELRLVPAHCRANLYCTADENFPMQGYQNVLALMKGKPKCRGGRQWFIGGGWLWDNWWRPRLGHREPFTFILCLRMLGIPLHLSILGIF